MTVSTRLFRLPGRPLLKPNHAQTIGRFVENIGHWLAKGLSPKRFLSSFPQVAVFPIVQVTESAQIDKDRALSEQRSADHTFGYTDELGRIKEVDNPLLASDLDAALNQIEVMLTQQFEPCLQMGRPVFVITIETGDIFSTGFRNATVARGPPTP